MHELSIAMSIVEMAGEEAERQGWPRVGRSSKTGRAVGSGKRGVALLLRNGLRRYAAGRLAADRRGNSNRSFLRTVQGAAPDQFGAVVLLSRVRHPILRYRAGQGT